MVQNQLYPPMKREADEYGPFFAHSLAFLSPGLAKLAALGRRWEQVMEDTEALSDGEKVKYLGLNFLVCGYRDVGEYLELVHEHRALLQEVV